MALMWRIAVLTVGLHAVFASFEGNDRHHDKPRHPDEETHHSVPGNGVAKHRHSAVADRPDALSNLRLGWKRVPSAVKALSEKTRYAQSPRVDEGARDGETKREPSQTQEMDEEEDDGDAFHEDMLFHASKKQEGGTLSGQRAGTLRILDDPTPSAENSVNAVATHRGLIRFELDGEFNYTDVDPVFYGTSLEYGNFPEGIDGTFQLSDFDTTVTILGRTSVAFAMQPFLVMDTTVLELNFIAETPGTRFHICFAKIHNRPYQKTRDNCILLYADSKARADTYGGFVVGEPWMVPVGEIVPFKVNIGHYMHEEVHWMGFRSGSRPESSTEQARVQISSIRLYNDENPLRLQVTAGGVEGGNVDTVPYPVPPRQVVTLSGVPKQYGNPYIYKDVGWSSRDELFTDQYSISEDQTSITLNGNVWKAWRFNYPISEDTVLEFDFNVSEVGKFHLICMDELRRDSFSSPYYIERWQHLGRVAKRCFHLARREPDTIGRKWTFVPQPETNISSIETTSWGENRTVVSQHFRIPVGHFLPKKRMKWMAFVQSTFGGTKNEFRYRHLGQSTFSNIRVYERPMRFHMEINGTTFVVKGPPTSFMPYDTLKRHDQYFIPEEDPSTVLLMGNAWKSFALNKYAVQGNTILEFDFALLQEAAAHAICVGELFYELHNCFFLGGTEQDKGAKKKIEWLHRLHVKEEDDIVEIPPMNGLTGVLGDAPDDGMFTGGYSYRIELGRFLSFRYSANYVAMVSSDPDHPPNKASSVFRNIRIYEEEDFPRLSVTVGGEKVLAGLPVWYIFVEDKPSGGLPKYSISQDGMGVTLYGNSWRAFPLEYQITSQTVLEVDVWIGVEAEDHAVCLTERLGGFAPLHCIKIAGAAPRYVPKEDDDKQEVILVDTDSEMRSNVTVVSPSVQDDDDDGNATLLVDRDQYAIDWRHVIETPVTASNSSEDGPTRVVITVGAILGTRDVKYLAFVSDADIDPSRGEITFGNITLYENEDLPWIPDTRDKDEATASSNAEQQGSDGKEIKVGALAGIIVAAVALIMMIVAVAALCLSAARKNQLREEGEAVP